MKLVIKLKQRHFQVLVLAISPNTLLSGYFSFMSKFE